jgi:hypothetical protein
MQRRDALKRLGWLSTGLVLSTTGLLNACTARQKSRTELTSKDVLLLDDIGETILPTTEDAVGAKAVAIGAYMLTTINDCYSIEKRATMIKGLDELEASCDREYRRKFVELSPSEKTIFLTKLDPKEKTSADHYITMLKYLTIHGYVTSELGATKFLRYDPVPGKFQIIPYKKGDKRWATN